MNLLSKGLRGVVKLIGITESAFRRIFYTTLYPGIAIHRSVHLERGVRLKATDGASIYLDAGVTIERNTTLVAKYGSIRIGKNTFIGEGSILVANSELTIGPDCLFAAGVTIRDQDHRFEDVTTPIRMQGNNSAPINIGTDVWLGSRVTVLKGVSIGSHSVAGANSLIAKDVPSGVIVVGTPAKIIKSRLVQEHSSPRSHK